VNKLEPAQIKEFKEELLGMLRKGKFCSVLSTFAVVGYEKTWSGLARSLTKPLNAPPATNKVQKLGRLTLVT